MRFEVLSAGIPDPWNRMRCVPRQFHHQKAQQTHVQAIVYDEWAGKDTQASGRGEIRDFGQNHEMKFEDGAWPGTRLFQTD
jgi:hypothetical protein